MSQEFEFDFDLQAFLKHLTELPGVYQMLDKQGETIYVGKAKNLKKRVSSYFNKQLDIKTQAMVAQVKRIKVTLTDTEPEALILESTLIKRLSPRYNILFRDDKSYPYIFVSSNHPYPGMYFHRGSQRKRGKYFGPFPNSGAVHQTLNSLQKIFPVRQCTDSFFNHRSRPCLQYQIKRCTAPCVGYITEEDYAADVRLSLMFLEGKSFQVIDELGQKMLGAAENLEFEKAARLRDKISALRLTQSQHLISQPGQKDMDVIALAQEAGQLALVIMLYRGGNLWGSETFYPKTASTPTYAESLAAFIAQHYQTQPVPKILLTSEKPDDQPLLTQWLSEKKGSKVQIKQARQAVDKNLVELALTNVSAGLQHFITQKATQQQKLAELQEVLGLASLPKKIEAFDISHTQGQDTQASCVVFDEGVPASSEYRRFNIKNIQANDDYAAIRQVVKRRYEKLRDQPEKLPDLIVVDGGKGQLNQAIEVLDELGFVKYNLIAMAEGGSKNKPTNEIFLTDGRSLHLEATSLAQHLLSHLRDEAHRFALAGHRARLKKRQTRSKLEEIPGVGPKTRKALLIHFGGLAAIEGAAVSELSKVSGVSQKLAQKIYDYFH